MDYDYRSYYCVLNIQQHNQIHGFLLSFLSLLIFLPLQTRQLLVKYPGLVVYGTARNPDASAGLQALKKRHPVRCELAQMDVTKEDTIEVKESSDHTLTI